MRVSIFFVTLLIVAAPPALASSTSTGISREFNPAISANSLIIYSSGLLSEESHEEVEEEHVHHTGHGAGLFIQESELQLSANVDPYTRATLTLAMHGSSGFELEEGYLRTQRLPAQIGLRLGQFYWEFGKHNSFHTHQYLFVERFHAWDELLGEHGLSGIALELSWLSPLPWYAELSGTAFPLTHTIYGEEAEIPENVWGQSARLRQLFEVSDRSTLDIGGTWLAGDVAHLHDDEIEKGDRVLLGVDLTWKWTGPGANARQMEIQGEWIRRSDSLPDEDIVHDGWYLSARAKVTRRVWLSARYDAFRPEAVEEGHSHFQESGTVTASMAFVPSEFQAWRLDLMRRTLGEENFNGLRLQANFTIGSHPAHRY